jgi:phosphoribosylamine--glycine ligase
MGAYSPAPVVTDELMAAVKEQVLDRFLAGIKAEKLFYRGVIYAGIMVTKDGPKVLEFNVRFGDPETQAVLSRLDSSLCDALYKTAVGKVNEIELVWSRDTTVCVVLASGGYPGTIDKGHVITGMDAAWKSGAYVFHAGTADASGKIVNSGGRVLGVTVRGQGIADAIRKVYEIVPMIKFDGMQYRKDIAHRALERLDK